jgi:hypothetical protein
MNLNFEEAIKHITGENRPKRAYEWIERFIEAVPTRYDDDKKFLKNWFANQNQMHCYVADFYRPYFAEWKRDEKKRSARISSFRRKPRRPPPPE